MRIGVVTTSYPRFADDPAGNFVGEHVAALRALGHTVEVIAAGDSHVQPADDTTRVAGDGLFYTGGAPDVLEQNPRRGLSAVRFSTRLALAVARAPRWDSVVAHWLAPSALACVIAAPRTPLLAIAHGGDIYTLRQLDLLPAVLDLLRVRGAQIVFVSEHLRQIAMDTVARPRTREWLEAAAVQPMGIDVERFAALPRTPSIPPSIVIASRLVRIKGVDVAIEALGHLSRPVRLTILGDGPERRTLEQAARGHEVRFLGSVDTRRRDRLLSSASLVIVPSRVLGSARTEGTPLIALEALAAGVPVVASDVGGLRNLFAVERVPPDDPRALATAIDRVLDAPPDREKLRQSVAHLDWKRVVHALVRSS